MEISDVLAITSRLEKVINELINSNFSIDDINTVLKVISKQIDESK